MSRSVEFFGETFRLAEKPNRYAMLRFIAMAKRGDEIDDADAADTLMDLLRRCLHADDWQRFDRTALDNDADWECDLLPVVAKVYEQVTDRPTQRPSDSSDGPSSTAPSSMVDSSSLASRLQGRPDLMVIVQDSQAAQRTA